MKEGMKKLFVGNLSWNTNEESLKTHFSKIGTVLSVRIITDPYTGKSKGFGFVEMETPELAAQAIRELNEQPFMDRNLRVSLALERSERGSGNREPRGEGFSNKPYRHRSFERERG